MLDNPNEHGIYPTSICFEKLDDLVDSIMIEYADEYYKRKLEENHKQENQKNIKYQVVPFEHGRFAIADENGKIIDNAQGYGFTTKQKAYAAASWKFGGGKQKLDENKQKYKNWLKENNIHDMIIKEFNDYLEWNFKEVGRGETTVKEIWDALEKQYNIKIPDYAKKFATD